MLARVAENLYWIGRNIERGEHCSRYLKVQYFSTLEAPMFQNRDFTLRSIIFMSGSESPLQGHDLKEQEVWQWVIFDSNNPNSIFSVVRNARENARSIRNKISTELWEAINKLYLYCKSRKETPFNSSDIYHFSEQINANIAVIKSNIRNTLLHNDTWHFLCAGLFVERGFQVLRILKSKISDCAILSDNGVNRALMQYQWTTMLKSLEAFDVHTTYYQGKMSSASIFEIILSNPIFPRSIHFTCLRIIEHLEGISVRPHDYQLVAEEANNTIQKCAQFQLFSKEDEVIDHIDELSTAFGNVHFKVTEVYFQ